MKKFIIAIIKHNHFNASELRPPSYLGATHVLPDHTVDVYSPLGAVTQLFERI